MGGRDVAMIEEVALFGTPLLGGVLCRPETEVRADLPGVVLLSPGLLHRVGPNRLYVTLSRALAADGFCVLRFDFSGQGDSPPRTDHVPLQRSVIEETSAAIDYVIARSGCSQVVLMGHCSGAAFSLMNAIEDDRVAGAIVISLEGGDDDWVEFDRRQKEARYYANYYSRTAITDSERWRRLLTGNADYRGIARNVLRNVIWYRISALGYRFRAASGMSTRAADERPEIAEFKQGLRGLAERGLPILLVHPDQSSGRELLRAILGDVLDELRAAGNLDVAYITDSDHVFTPVRAQQDLVEAIRGWLRTAGFAPALVASAGEEAR